jgi:hypothetical protein
MPRKTKVDAVRAIDRALGRKIGEPRVTRGSAVDHPAHYKLGAVEVIDAIEAWSLGFCLGNAVKYIARAGKKNPAKLVEDLEKARWYLDREIARLNVTVKS